MATPTSNNVVVTYDLQQSFNNEIDSLIGGTKWGQGLGTGVTLPYSFPLATATYDSSYGQNGNASEWNAGWTALDTTQQLAFESVLSVFSGVANITFVELSDSATSVGEIRIAISQQVDIEGSGAWAYLPSSNPSAGDIWLSPDSFLSDSIVVGSWQFNTLIHELGHAIGLSHPFSSQSGSGASLPQGVDGSDNIFYTVMSYTDDPSGNEYSIDRYPETPMLLDIQALQYLYGTNTSHNSGDTTYVFTSNGKYFETIWDGGGRDSIDYTGSNSGATIDLREGQWSSLGRPIVFTNDNGIQQYNDVRTVWIAYGTEIEDAKGSKTNDVIYGNDLANELYGYLGIDSISGFGGDDKFVFSLDGNAAGANHGGSPGIEGTGDQITFTDKWQSLDTYNGGDGNDTLWSDASNDAIFLDNGSASPLLISIETIDTRGGDDVVDLTSNSHTYGDVSVYTGDGNDVIWSNNGDDHLYGEAGDDTILGWQGADSILGGSGNDLLEGGQGNDYLDGGSGIDVARYKETKDLYAITLSGTSAKVVNNSEGSDSLDNVERIIFSDANLAVDLHGNAGTTVKILGSVFGANSISNQEYVGIGLNLLDEGMEYEALMEFALTAAGAVTNESVVELLYTNLVNSAPTNSESAPYLALLEGGMSKGALGVFAADHDLNIANIDLIGLAQTGVEFI